MIGDEVTDDGMTYEVVWSGGEGLVPGRETKPSGFWTPPKRLYNKKSDYWKKTDDNTSPETPAGDV